MLSLFTPAGSHQSSDPRSAGVRVTIFTHFQMRRCNSIVFCAGVGSKATCRCAGESESVVRYMLLKCIVNLIRFKMVYTS